MARQRKHGKMFLKGGLKGSRRLRKLKSMSRNGMPKIYPPNCGLPALPEEKRVI
jgi:hypothetical protein